MSTFTVNWPLLLVALLLLWAPRKWLRLGAAWRVNRKGHHLAAQQPWVMRDRGDPRMNPRGEFAKFRNYVDLLRAAGGALAIVGGMGIAPGIGLADQPGGRAGLTLLAVQAAILLAGLVIQTARFERNRLTFYPPVFYLAGISVALCGGWAALFAFILIWSVNPMFGNAQAFLTVYSLLLVGFGLGLHGVGSRLPILAGVLSFLPVLFSLLARRPLIVPARKATHAGGGAR